MTQGALALMKHLTGIHGVGYSRDRACRATGLSSRTIDRALSELVSCRAISRKKGGRGESSKITIISSLPEFLARQVKMAHHVPQNGASKADFGASSGAINISEEERKKESPGFQNLTEQELEILVSMGTASGVEIWAAIHKLRIANRQQEHGVQRDAGVSEPMDRKPGSKSLPARAIPFPPSPPRKPPERDVGFLAEQVRQLVASKSLNRRRI